MPIASELLNSLVQMNFANAPVAVAFLDTAPAGLPRVERAEPASCGYWKSASLGRSFYTTPEDHGNCAVGAYTHGVSLSPALGQELQGLVGTMIDLKYLKNEDVAALPHRSTPLKFAAYAPLDQGHVRPGRRGVSGQRPTGWRSGLQRGAGQACRAPCSRGSEASSREPAQPVGRSLEPASLLLPERFHRLEPGGAERRNSA